jgi:hypothetical protein
MGVVDVLGLVAPAWAGGWGVDVSRGEQNGRVSSELFNRPDEGRYLSLDDLWANVKSRSERSRSRVVQTEEIRVEAARGSRAARLSRMPVSKWMGAPRSSSTESADVAWVALLAPQ